MAVKQVFNFECDRCKAKLEYGYNRTPPGWRYLEWEELLGAPNSGCFTKRLHLCPVCYTTFQQFLQGGFVADVRPGQVIPVEGDPSIVTCEAYTGNKPHPTHSNCLEPKVFKPTGFVRSWLVLVQFVRYCLEHPTERFWQALRNWSEAYAIRYVQPGNGGEESVNTLYWEGKKGNQ